MITIKELIESESKDEIIEKIIEVFYTSKDNEKKERARNNFSITLNDIDNIIPNKNIDKFVMIPSIIYESYGEESKSVSIYKLEEIEKLDLTEELKIDIPFKGGIKEWEAEVIDILPTPKGEGFWYHQTVPDCSGLIGSPPQADAPAL